jgi:hypothetical protein
MIRSSTKGCLLGYPAWDVDLMPRRPWSWFGLLQMLKGLKSRPDVTEWKDAVKEVL